MNDEPRFDAAETELRRRFDGALTDPDDTEAVLAAMRPRLRRARRNRRMMRAGAAVVAVAAASVISFAALGSQSDSVRVRPANPASSTTAPAPRPSEQHGDNQSPAPSGNALPQSSDSARAPSATGPGDTRGEQVPRPTSPTPSNPSTTVPVASDAPFSSPGGSIVVRRVGSSISLASSTPAAGFVAQVHDNGPTRVEVRFTEGSTEWRIRVDLVGDQLQSEVTQH